MGGSTFVVVDPATQGFTPEATAAIVAQIATQIEGKFAAFLGSEGEQLLNTLPSILKEVANLKAEVATLTAQLNERVPEVSDVRSEVATLTTQLNERMPEIGSAQIKLDESLQNLVKRDQAVSDKFKASFADVDARLEDVALKSSTVESMQTSVHEAVARQQMELASAKADVERVVTKALSDVANCVQQNVWSGGGGGAPPREPREDNTKLNDFRKTEVEGLTDTMSRAAFVLWRDNLDLHLKEFNDFGLGTN